jgi:RNA polymerase sigma factor (sigma-70 family)
LLPPGHTGHGAPQQASLPLGHERKGSTQVDIEEFERFFGVMRPRLLAFNRRWTDVDTANELAVQALAAIWDKDLPAPADVESQARLESLAFRICEGLIRNHQRGVDRRHRLVAAIQQERLVGPASPQSPDAVLESLDLISSLLDTLSRGEREVVELVIRGYKVSEIATLLQTRPGTISMRLKRARESLRARWDRLHHD